MQTELSAGAVICRKDPNSWEVLVIRDMKGNLTFPKGLIEKGESAVDTAVREAHEETGIENIFLKDTLPNVRYIYKRGGTVIHKTVRYFLFTYEGKESLRPQQEEGISEVLWVPLSAAINSIGYPKSNTKLLTESIKILHTYDH